MEETRNVYREELQLFDDHIGDLKIYSYRDYSDQVKVSTIQERLIGLEGVKGMILG